MRLNTAWYHSSRKARVGLSHIVNGPLTRYAKLRVAHAPGMPGTFSPPPLFSDPDKHHGTCLTHVPWCMPGSLSSGFLWSRRRGKRSWHSRRMRNPQFCVSDKRSMAADMRMSTRSMVVYLVLIEYSGLSATWLITLPNCDVNLLTTDLFEVIPNTYHPIGINAIFCSVLYDFKRLLTFTINQSVWPFKSESSSIISI